MMTTNFGLFLDRESLGPRVLKNPTVALGACLVDMDRVCIHIEEGEECIKEVYVPPVEGQEEDLLCVRSFWERNESNKKQLEEWRGVEGGHEKRTLKVKEFVQWCEKVCQGKKVELFVDTPLYDVVGVDALLDSCSWEDKPPSWSYLLKGEDGKRMYSKIIDISSYLEGALLLHPQNMERCRKHPGGLPNVTRIAYNLPSPPNFPYTRDHHCSHDAARRGLEFASIRNYLKIYSVV